MNQGIARLHFMIHSSTTLQLSYLIFDLTDQDRIF